MPGKPNQTSSEAARERRIDEAGAESFPASDPPAIADDQGGDAHADEARGTPDSDRHASETAAGRQDGARPAEHKTH